MPLREELEELLFRHDPVGLAEIGAPKDEYWPEAEIGGTAVGTVLTLVFLPALYSLWFGVRPTAVPSDETQEVLAHS